MFFVVNWFYNYIRICWKIKCHNCIEIKETNKCSIHFILWCWSIVSIFFDTTLKIISKNHTYCWIKSIILIFLTFQNAIDNLSICPHPQNVPSRLVFLHEGGGNGIQILIPFLFPFFAILIRTHICQNTVSEFKSDWRTFHFFTTFSNLENSGKRLRLKVECIFSAILQLISPGNERYELNVV